MGTQKSQPSTLRPWRLMQVNSMGLMVPDTETGATMGYGYASMEMRGNS